MLCVVSRASFGLVRRVSVHSLMQRPYAAIGDRMGLLATVRQHKSAKKHAVFVAVSPMPLSRGAGFLCVFTPIEPSALSSISAVNDA